MDAAQLRIVGSGLLFAGIFVSGLWLGSAGRPYNGLLFNVHKLVALGALVLLAGMAYQAHQQTPLAGMEVTISALTALLFVATIVTGGLVSIDWEVPVLLSRAHWILPFLTAFSSAGLLYLLLNRPVA